TSGTDYRDAPAHPEVLPLALLAPLPGLLQRPARSYINPVPLVVEVGAVVDLFELGLDEVDATPFPVVGPPVDLLYPGDRGSATPVRRWTPWLAPGDGCVDRLGHSLQGRAVLPVVGSGACVAIPRSWSPPIFCARRHFGAPTPRPRSRRS